MSDPAPSIHGQHAFDYIKEATVTASNNYHGELVPAIEFAMALQAAIQALSKLDRIKKSLFYGRKFDEADNYGHNFVPSHHFPARIDSENRNRGELILHSILGAATESGEQLEILAKCFSSEQGFDEVNFIEEIGDMFWYQAIGAHAVNTSFDEIQRRNIAKLRHRFPQKFTEYDANNRDLFGERKILEMHKEQATPEIAKQRATIENWCLLPYAVTTREDGALGRLIGNVYNHPQHEDGKHVTTSAVFAIDYDSGRAVTRNTIYKLGIRREAHSDSFNERD